MTDKTNTPDDANQNSEPRRIKIGSQREPQAPVSPPPAENVPAPSSEAPAQEDAPVGESDAAQPESPQPEAPQAEASQPETPQTGAPQAESVQHTAGSPAAGAETAPRTQPEPSHTPIKTQGVAERTAPAKLPLGQATASYGGDAPTQPKVGTSGRRPTAEELFPGSVVDQMTGDMEAEFAEILGDVSIDDLMGGASSSGTAAAVELDKRYAARVIKTDRESVFFTFGEQHEGVAPRRMFEESLEPGTEVTVVPTRYLSDDGLYEVVVPGASVEVQDWSDLSEGVVVEAKITGHNKGGLECEVNHIRGFMPISHIELFRVDDLEGYVGQAMQCIVTEANESRRNLVVSRRAVLEREREAAREELLESLEVGQIREGTITRLQDFGAFVDLGGIDGLIHVSQLSWDRVQHPSEVVEEGQKVKVRIEKLDTAAGRIGLSYRDLLEDPWDGADTKYAVSSVVDGVVSKIMEFGAFVKLAPGVEGLVHISEIAHHRVSKVGAFLKEGQDVSVKVLSMDVPAQRISLSIKAAQATPEKEEAKTDDAEEAAEAAKPVVAKREGPLKGGLNRPSGGEEFGLKW